MDLEILGKFVKTPPHPHLPRFFTEFSFTKEILVYGTVY